MSAETRKVLREIMEKAIEANRTVNTALKKARDVDQDFPLSTAPAIGLMITGSSYVADNLHALITDHLTK